MDAGPKREASGRVEPDIALASGDLPEMLWERILHTIKSRKIILHAYLVAAVKREYHDGVLSVYFDPSKGAFHKERSQEKENLPLIEAAVSEDLGAPVKVEFDFLRGEQEKDPVDKAIEIFGRDIVKLV
jgi:hypothetical protein